MYYLLNLYFLKKIIVDVDCSEVRLLVCLLVVLEIFVVDECIEHLKNVQAEDDLKRVIPKTWTSAWLIHSNCVLVCDRLTDGLTKSVTTQPRIMVKLHSF